MAWIENFTQLKHLSINIQLQHSNVVVGSPDKFDVSLSQLLYHSPQLETVEVWSRLSPNLDYQRPENTKKYISINLKKFGCHYLDFILDFLKYLSFQPNLKSLSLLGSSQLQFADTTANDLFDNFHQHQNQIDTTNPITKIITHLEFKDFTFDTLGNSLNTCNLFANLTHLTINWRYYLDLEWNDSHNLHLDFDTLQLQQLSIDLSAFLRVLEDAEPGHNNRRNQIICH